MTNKPESKTRDRWSEGSREDLSPPIGEKMDGAEDGSKEIASSWHYKQATTLREHHH